MSIGARVFRWHRWLAWLVALQVLAWVGGGLVFSWLPFKAWVKGEDFVRRPAQVLPADWAAAVARQLAQPGLAPVTAVQSVVTAGGPALRLRHEKGETWLRADGSAFEPPDAAAVERFARSLYAGPPVALQVQRLDEVPRRALIVREAPAGVPLWRARFDDAIGTRLYIGAAHGDLVAVRNDAWVLYDFFWRLHLMDYGEGEDFNHLLIRAASLAGFALAFTGAVLALRAAWRAWRTARRQRAARN